MSVANEAGSRVILSRIERMDNSVVAPGGGIENTSRLASALGNVAVLTSGTMRMSAINLPTRELVSSITFISGATPAGTPTNQWAALYDSSLNLLGQTQNDTTTAWGANDDKTFTFRVPFKTSASGLHYVGLLVTAATPPTMMGLGGSSAANAVTPVLYGNSTASLTTAAPDPAGAITSGSNNFWCCVA